MTRTLVLLFLALGLAACGIPQPVASEAAISRFERASVALPAGYKLNYLRAGTPGAPRIIFVHGTPGDAMGWTDYLASPPDGVEIIAVDRPGFGGSGPDGAVTSLREQAAALLPLLVEVNGRKPILVGHSLGGPIIARAAVDYPDKVGAIILAAAAMDPALEETQWVQYLGDTVLFSWMLPRALRNANQELMALKPHLQSLAPRLSTISMPIVIVHGDKDDLVPFANVDFMKSNFARAPRMHYILIEGMNHFLPWGAMDKMKSAIHTAMDMTWTQK